MNSERSNDQSPVSKSNDFSALLGGATSSFRRVVVEINSLAEQGVNYMLCVVGVALIVYLAIVGVIGEGSLATSEFIALVAGATVIVVAGASFRAVAAQSSLRESTKVAESSLELARKALDNSDDARKKHTDLSN